MSYKGVSGGFDLTDKIHRMSSNLFSRNFFATLTLGRFHWEMAYRGLFYTGFLIHKFLTSLNLWIGKVGYILIKILFINI